MSDYNQSISFGAKDSLPSGNPAKKILGADVDTELGLVSAAISSKLDKFSGFTQEAPDQTNDTTVFYDVSTGLYKKATISSLSTPALTGSIIAYAGTATPSGYLECNGSNVSRATYAALFSAVGVTWGAGDGTTTFTLPDLRRRTMIGKGGTAGSGSPGIAVGNSGGTEVSSFSLVLSQLPSHNHHVFTNTTGSSAMSTYAAKAGTAGAADTKYDMNEGNSVPTIGLTSSAGSGSAITVNTMQPSAVVGFFIKI
jgi:microcystin-dependent protein